MNIFEDSEKNELKENDSIIILDNDTLHLMIGDIIEMNEKLYCKILWCTNSFDEEYPLGEICNNKKYQTHKIESNLMEHKMVRGYEIEINDEIITIFGDARDFKCNFKGYCDFQEFWIHNICKNPEDCENKEWALNHLLNRQEKVFN